MKDFFDRWGLVMMAITWFPILEIMQLTKFQNETGYGES